MDDLWYTEDYGAARPPRLSQESVDKFVESHPALNGEKSSWRKPPPLPDGLETGDSTRKDFALPHHDSKDGKSIEYPMTIDQSVLKSVLTQKDPIRTSGYSLIPPEPLGELARVFQIGAEKY